MRRFLAVLILLLTVPATAAAQPVAAPETPELRITISPAEALTTRAYIHGQLVLRLRLISRHAFEELRWTAPQIDGAKVIELARPRTRKLSGYAGQGYVFEAVFAVTPLKSGILTIPAATAIGKTAPAPDEELAFDLETAPISITVADPPASYDADWWLVVPRVEMDETWSTPVEEIRVNDIVQRRVSLRVWGVEAERLPALTHAPAQGVRISLRSAETRTEISAEGLIAHADYVWDLEVESPQVVFIKPISLKYWDPLSDQIRAKSVPAHRIEPLAADSEAIAAALMAEAAAMRDRNAAIAIAAAGALALPLAAALALVLAAATPTRADLRLWRACRAGAAPEDLFLAIDRWLIDTGLPDAACASRLPARRAISDRLFAPQHPEHQVRRALISQALRWSRRARLSALAQQWLAAKGHTPNS